MAQKEYNMPSAVETQIEMNRPNVQSILQSDPNWKVTFVSPDGETCYEHQITKETLWSKTPIKLMKIPDKDESKADDEIHHDPTFFGQHKNLYFLKYTVMSLITCTSKILDIVFCYEYLWAIVCGTWGIFEHIECKVDPIRYNYNTTLEWFRFIGTFIFGFVCVILIYYFMMERLPGREDKSMKKLGIKDTTRIVVTIFLFFVTVPILILSKLAIVIVRFVSIFSFYVEIHKLKKQNDIEYIPDKLKCYWGIKVAIPETLLSGSILLAVTIAELVMIEWDIRGILLRVMKIVFGVISLIMGIKDCINWIKFRNL